MAVHRGDEPLAGDLLHAADAVLIHGFAVCRQDGAGNGMVAVILPMGCQL